MVDKRYKSELTSIASTDAVPLRQLVSSDALRQSTGRPDSVQNVPTDSKDASASISDPDEEESNIQLGLGDFIFYSLMVIKSAKSGNAFACLSTFAAVLVGLTLTLIILIMRKQALPALPISIALGVSVHFFIIYVAEPWNEALQHDQIFVWPFSHIWCDIEAQLHFLSFDRKIVLQSFKTSKFLGGINFN